MSIAIMSRVWTIPLPDSEKLVLLALADAAKDEGVCWPSMAMHALLRRQVRQTGRAAPNPKRVYRVTKVHRLLL